MGTGVDVKENKHVWAKEKTKGRKRERERDSPVHLKAHAKVKSNATQHSPL